MVDFNNAFGGFGPIDPMLQQRLAAMAAAQNQTMVPMQPGIAGPVGNMLESAPMAPGMNMLERGAAVAPQMQPQVGFTPPGGNKLESAVATHGSGPMDLGAMTQPSQPQFQPMPMGDRPAMQRGFNPDKAEMLQDLFIGWASGSNVGDSLAKGALMMREGKKSREEKAKAEGQTNQTVAWLQSKGMDPAQAEMIASNPSALGQYLQTTFMPQAGAQPTDDMREYEFAKSQGFQGTFEEYVRRMKEAGRTQVNVDTGVKLPSGYQWRDPNDQSKGVVPIPGGPATQIPAELAARVGMAESYLGQFPEIRSRIEAGGQGDVVGPVDALAGQFGIGASGETYRQMQSGVDALQRMLTGAGMNVAEAQQYASRYLPSIRDDQATVLGKMDQLKRELEAAKNKAMQGRGDTPAAPQAGGVVDWQTYFGAQ